MNKTICRSAILSLGLCVLLIFWVFRPSAQADDLQGLRAELESSILELIRLKHELLHLRERNSWPSPGLEIFLEVVRLGPQPPHFHALPGLVELTLDESQVLRHQYTDTERIALTQEGLQRLYFTELAPGIHNLIVSYSGTMKNSRKYLKILPLTFQKTSQHLRIFLRLEDAENEPRLSYKLHPGFSEEPKTYLRQRALYAFAVDEHLAALSFWPPGQGNDAAAGNVDLSFKIAESYQALSLPLSATQAFQNLLKNSRDPFRQAQARIHLGQIQYDENRFEETLETVRTLTTASTSIFFRDEALYLMGNSHLKGGRPEEALKSYQKISHKSRWHPYALFSQAVSQVRQEDTAMAAASLEQLAEIFTFLQPQLKKLASKARLALGYLHLQQGDPRKALAEFDSIPLKHQDAERFLYGRGRALMQIGDYTTALGNFSQLIKQFPASPYAMEARLARGELHARLGLLHPALKDYREALSVFERQIEEEAGRLRTMQQRDEQQGKGEIQALEAQNIPIPEWNQWIRQGWYPEKEDLTLALAIEQYQLLLQLQNLVLEERKHLPAGSLPVELAGGIENARQDVFLLASRLMGYVDKSMIKMVKKRMEDMDFLAVRACLGIADALAVLMDEES